MGNSLGAGLSKLGVIALRASQKSEVRSQK
jgi:hypothetical protein